MLFLLATVQASSSSGHARLYKQTCTIARCFDHCRLGNGIICRSSPNLRKSLRACETKKIGGQSIIHCNCGFHGMRVSRCRCPSPSHLWNAIANGKTQLGTWGGSQPDSQASLTTTELGKSCRERLERQQARHRTVVFIVFFTGSADHIGCKTWIRSNLARGMALLKFRKPLSKQSDTATNQYVLGPKSLETLMPLLPESCCPQPALPCVFVCAWIVLILITSLR